MDAVLAFLGLGGVCALWPGSTAPSSHEVQGSFLAEATGEAAEIQQFPADSGGRSRAPCPRCSLIWVWHWVRSTYIIEHLVKLVGVHDEVGVTNHVVDCIRLIGEV